MLDFNPIDCAHCYRISEEEGTREYRINGYDVLSTPSSNKDGDEWDADIQKLRIHFEGRAPVTLFVFRGKEFISEICSGKENIRLTIGKYSIDGTEHVFENIRTGKKYSGYSNLRFYWG